MQCNSVVLQLLRILIPATGKAATTEFGVKNEIIKSGIFKIKIIDFGAEIIEFISLKLLKSRSLRCLFPLVSHRALPLDPAKGL